MALQHPLSLEEGGSSGGGGLSLPKAPSIGSRGGLQLPGAPSAKTAVSLALSLLALMEQQGRHEVGGGTNI